MSNQSGIKASAALLDAYRAFTIDDGARTMLVKIENESLEPGEIIKAEAGYFDDAALLAPYVTDTEPLYILYRTDRPTTASTAATGLVLISYIPDAAPVRRKMLFASTRNTLVRELGGDRITASFFTTDKREITPDGLRKFAEHDKVSQPLTDEERALRSVREVEATEGFAGTTTRKSHVSSGLAFPISQAAATGLAGLNGAARGEYNLVVLEIDVQNESIELAKKAQIEEPTHLHSMISTDQPRYTFFLFRHTVGDVDHESLVFIYTCPGGSKVKERMLYASCRAAIVAEAEAAAGLKVDRRIEAGDGSEVTRESLIADLHPQQQETKRVFARPKAPGRRR
ncbi:hypothetical protein V1517DRAFT_306771 [Lipomyces orientalis]|uniref:Uncharacterized protein n=1 Tax=Lipomyces orientalis TaxID=1233043 RepID=A0ACC3TUE4_9ASCO